MRKRAESGPVDEGRALEDGDEIDLPDPLAAQDQQEERDVERKTVRDPKPRTRDPRSPRRR